MNCVKQGITTPSLYLLGFFLSVTCNFFLLSKFMLCTNYSKSFLSITANVSTKGPKEWEWGSIIVYQKTDNFISLSRTFKVKKKSGNQDFFLKNQEVIRNILALKVTISYKIISKGRLPAPLSKSFLQRHNIFPICKLFQFMFWWLTWKWKRNKARNQQTDLKTEYQYYSSLHEVKFIKSRAPFECSYSNLVHQQNTIEQLFKLHSSKFTI